MLEGVSTSSLLMYAGIFVLALALIVLVLWVSRISSKLSALKQALMIEQRKLEEIERQLGFGGAYGDAFGSASYEAPSPSAENVSKSGRSSLRRVDRSAAFSGAGRSDLRQGADMDNGGPTGEIDFVDGDIDGLSEDAMPINDAQSLRQQEQMQRISRARERQAKLKQKHNDEMAAELRRKQEMARRRDEQVRNFQKQQEALRRRLAQEQAEQAAEEERLNKLRTRASWSGSGANAARPRQRTSSTRLEERRQAQLRKQAEEIIQTRLGNAGETNYFGNPVDFR